MLVVPEDVDITDALREMGRLMELVDQSPLLREYAAHLLACGVEPMEIIRVPHGRRAQLADPFWNLLEEAT
jgi:hypothetical protein